jgi:hypothetical protein
MAPKMEREGFCRPDAHAECPCNQVKTVTAQGSLVEMTDHLHKTYGVARVLDARLPLVGQDMQPVMKVQPSSATNRWVLPGAMVSMGTLMALASE